MDKLNFDMMLNILGCVIQITLAAIAWLTFCITVRKIPSITKVKIKVLHHFCRVMEEPEAKVKIHIRMVNLGMAQLTVEEIGVYLRRPLKKKKKLVPLNKFENLCLTPGAPHTEKLNFDFQSIKSKIISQKHEKIKVGIYVKYHLGEVYYSKSMRFSDFKFEYDRAKEGSDEVNRELKEIEREVEF